MAQLTLRGCVWGAQFTLPWTVTWLSSHSVDDVDMCACGSVTLPWTVCVTQFTLRGQCVWLSSHSMHGVDMCACGSVTLLWTVTWFSSHSMDVDMYAVAQPHFRRQCVWLSSCSMNSVDMSAAPCMLLGSSQEWGSRRAQTCWCLWGVAPWPCVGPQALAQLGASCFVTKPSTFVQASCRHSAVSQISGG